jgi:hypothetical protein
MIADRDEFILESVRQALPMLNNIAYRCHVPLEDLYQEAALVATLRFEQACTADRPRAYLQSAIRLAALTYVSHTYHDDAALSLDAPLNEEHKCSLGELLADRSENAQDQAEEIDARCAALHHALHRLPLEEQLYLREVHHLYSFNPLPPDWDVKPNYHRSRSAMSHAAYGRLRRDQELAATIVEVRRWL